MLVQRPGDARLSLVAPVDVAGHPRARAVAERLAASNGPIGAVEYVDVRESMRNGGGPACLRLRVGDDAGGGSPPPTPPTAWTSGCTPGLSDWIGRRYRDRLAPEDLADPAMIEEGRTALEELDTILS